LQGTSDSYLLIVRERQRIDFGGETETYYRYNRGEHESHK
jgi:hypothetical protein